MPEPTEPEGRQYEAVIFDCDGVLVDSEPAHDAATIKEFLARGIEIPPVFLHQHKGRRVSDQISLISERYGLDANDVLQSREARFWSSVGDQVSAIPGSAACVRALRTDGIGVAVATSGSRRWIEHVLDLLDLREDVSQVVSGDDVLRPKPHPEPYLRASDLLGVSTDRCVVVEDAVLGVRSARAAGGTVVVLASASASAPREMFPGASAYAASMDEVLQILRSMIDVTAPSTEAAG